MMVHDFLQHKLRLLTTITMLGACVSGPIAGCSSNTAVPAEVNESNRAGLRELQSIPMASVGGRQYKLRDFQGQIVMLHFFSSWCGQCTLEAPTLRNVYNSFKDSKFTIVGVAVDDDPFQMQAFVSKFQLPFPVLFDVAGDFKEFFGIKELPTTLFLNRQGIPIRFADPATGKTTERLVGPRMWDTSEPVEMIARLVENL